MDRHLISTLLFCVCMVVTASEDQIVKLGCSSNDITEFMNSNLSPECRNGLTSLQYKGDRTDKSQPFVPSMSDLDTVCQEGCGGAYTSWLRDSCEDPYRARMVEAMCVFTAETTAIGERCRYSFPDAIANLNSYFNGVFHCGLGATQNTCPARCPAPMNALINLLGCCYSSVYNNTEFVQYLQNTGLINSTVSESLLYLGRVPDWQLCEVNVPPLCETIITYQRPSSAPGYPYFGMCSLLTLAMMTLSMFI